MISDGWNNWNCRDLSHRPERSSWTECGSGLVLPAHAEGESVVAPEQKPSRKLTVGKSTHHPLLAWPTAQKSLRCTESKVSLKNEHHQICLKIQHLWVAKHRRSLWSDDCFLITNNGGHYGYE